MERYGDGGRRKQRPDFAHMGGGSMRQDQPGGATYPCAARNVDCLTPRRRCKRNESTLHVITNPTDSTDTRATSHMPLATVIPKRHAVPWQRGRKRNSSKRRRGSRMAVADGTVGCGCVARPDPLPSPEHFPKNLRHLPTEARRRVHADDGGGRMTFYPPR